jgi:hypothetical protein
MTYSLNIYQSISFVLNESYFISHFSLDFLSNKSIYISKSLLENILENDFSESICKNKLFIKRNFGNDKCAYSGALILFDFLNKE